MVRKELIQVYIILYASQYTFTNIISLDVYKKTLMEVGQVLLKCEKTEAQKEENCLRSRCGSQDLQPGLSPYLVHLTLYSEVNSCANMLE